ncbi:hypothetical protein [Bradyrhizobium sp. 2TAF24]|uniref:hypothetical protein n=1 Tax=Bradyrhizobium sp. 2TAF24 TaxID=3233011 RepID=UPI003F9378CE
MANDAFALSPISASSALPSEADYHAISEAFMETSRGRWFLKEYSRRNRNADTAMVLEAVERIEGVLAAQKQPAPAAAPIAETIAAVRAIVENARGAAAEALAGLNAEDARAPTRKGLRIILEIAWRLREIGYDTRICDILETQANTIGANQDALAALQTSDSVLAAFDDILRQIGALTDAPPAPAAAETAAPHPVAENVVSLKPAAPAARATPALAEETAGMAAAPAAAAPEEIAREAAAETPAVPEAAAAPAMPSIEDEIAALTAMAVVEPRAEARIAADAGQAPSVEPPPVEAAAAPMAAAMPEPVTAPAAVPQAMPSAAPAAAVASEPTAVLETAAASPSLGDALLARGMVTAPRPQPLAAILRMSQAEKIAFFS